MQANKQIYDVIVVGSGHAGVEAGYASARKGCSTLMVTVDWQKTAHMSCNPSIGGLGKGHIVKEIDILGGLMPRMADKACIQFRLLNRSKGPAVRGSRTQCDKNLYSLFVRKYLEGVKNLSFLSTEVKALLIEKGQVKGVITDKGETIYSKAVVLTTGTFMRGLMHIGSHKNPGGRVGEKATEGLSDQLKTLGFPVYRLKTGTPPRLKKQSINFASLTAQQGDKEFEPFSFFSPLKLNLPQRLCHITYTNEKTHDLIKKNLKHSALFSGAIEGKGPRYCPSVEDKIIRFAEKTRHLSFLEPETLDGDSIYLQGLSTSLPAAIQLKFLRTIKGLEQVEILKPGYAVEYDFLDPLYLLPTLETKIIKNLFFAGQINGSSGYEEAAGQGLVAGLNASAKIQGEEPLILKRHTAYIGVLIDDLVTKGTKEPYRMLTSRAEHRLILREDNVIERLFKIANKHNLLSSKKKLLIEKELNKREALFKFLSQEYISPNEEIKKELRKVKAPELTIPQTLKKFLSRPEMDGQKLLSFIKNNKTLKAKLKKQNLLLSEEKQTTKPHIKTKKLMSALEIKAKYEGYIKREMTFIAQNQKMENLKLLNINYDKVKGLSLEALEKLKQINPRTLAQATRVSGVTPSAIQALLIHLKTRKLKKHVKTS